MAFEVFPGDSLFSGQFARVLGHTCYGGADAGECLSTAQRIAAGDVDGWYREWQATGERLFEIAEACGARGVPAGVNLPPRLVHLFLPRAGRPAPGGQLPSPGRSLPARSGAVRPASGSHVDPVRGPHSARLLLPLRRGRGAAPGARHYRWLRQLCPRAVLFRSRRRPPPSRVWRRVSPTRASSTSWRRSRAASPCHPMRLTVPQTPHPPSWLASASQ